jgi:hypothetical protein
MKALKREGLTKIRDEIKSWMPRKDIKQADGRMASSREFEEARSSLSNLASKIDYEVTKLSLGILIASTKEQIDGLCDALKLPITMFGQSARGILPFLKTDSMKKIVAEECGHLLRAVLELVKSTMDILSKDGDKVDPVKVGLVTEYCKRFKMRIPKSDKIACKRFVMSSILQIKDTAEEFQQSISGEEDDDMFFIGDDLGDGDAEKEVMTEKEKLTIGCAVKVFRRSQRLCKTYAQACVSLPDSFNKSQTDLANSLVELSSKLVSAVTDMGCCLYIPIEKESEDEILKHVKTLEGLAKQSSTLLLKVPTISSDMKIETRIRNMCTGLISALSDLKGHCSVHT